ncbi:SMP-30/gluconolactonase/LRE family protein [Asticcacaulis sp.]|uniref:SMP-30/gluconolactonase/LRE family protein n=1 Tax=Asticcacaulis sp. TaxID=1872648 RepID=UPI002B6EE9A5|nr:SMP-30/gluconolactonase/LRE family protein [Asticcacaulis sp.]HTM81531.1 SMP-30/gluconolactonase/LRE family protein [Asticcacaulis sp.]
MSNHRVHLINAIGNIVGESPVWCQKRQRLQWVDICGKTIHAFTPTTGVFEKWDTPDLVTAIGLRVDGGAVVALRRTVALWEFGGPFIHLATPEPDLLDNRLNEGAVGPDGAFWVGTMQNNIGPNNAPTEISKHSGAFHRVQMDGQVESLTPAEFGICNTMIWPDDRTFICADTLENQLYRYRFGEDGLETKKSFATFARGLPDGSAQDFDGFIWNARVGGGCIVRFAPDGSVDRIVDVPCQLPTSCAFGGPDLKTLYVTSARFGLPAAQESHPREGALYAITTDIPGLAPNLFGISRTRTGVQP